MKKFLFLLTFCFTTPLLPINITVQHPEYHLLNGQEIDNGIIKYRWPMIQSLAAGIAAGSFTGILAKSTEHYGWPIVWALSALLRRSLVNGINEIAIHQNHIPNVPLMRTSAWVSSWIAYLMSYRLI